MNKRIPFVFFIGINIFRNLTGLLRAKILAIYWGVSYVGIFGQLLTLHNLQTKLLIFGTSAALNSLIGKSNELNREYITKLCLYLIVISNIFYLSVIIFYIHQISDFLLKSSDQYKYILSIVLLGPLFSIFSFLEILNQSEKKFENLIKGQTISTSIAFLLIIPLVIYYGVYGIIIDFAIWFSSSIVYFIKERFYLITLKKSDFIHFKEIFRPVLKICLTDLSRNISIFTSILLFRIILIQLLNINQSGYFQAIWSINSYIDVLLQGFIVFLFPTMSFIKNDSEFNLEINRNFSRIMHILLPFITILFLFPKEIMIILYSSDFELVSSKLNIMTLGKFFEFYYLFYMIILLSKRKLRLYLGLELFRSIIFIIIPYMFIKQYQLSGAIWSIFFIQFLSFSLLNLFLIKNVILKLDKNTIKMYLIIVCGFSSILIFNIWRNEINIFYNIIIIIGIYYFATDLRYYKNFFTDVTGIINNKLCKYKQ